MKDQGLPGIMQSLSGKTNCAETGVFQHGDETKGALTEEQSGGVGRESSEDWFIDTYLRQDKEAKSPSQLLKDWFELMGLGSNSSSTFRNIWSGASYLTSVSLFSPSVTWDCISPTKKALESVDSVPSHPLYEGLWFQTEWQLRTNIYKPSSWTLSLHSNRTCINPILQMIQWRAERLCSMVSKNMNEIHGVLNCLFILASLEIRMPLTVDVFVQSSSSIFFLTQWFIK